MRRVNEKGHVDCLMDFGRANVLVPARPFSTVVNMNWLQQLRRLRVRAERRADIHDAFMALGCIIVTSYFL